jgi:uroporphyrinogen-III synthase
LEEIMNIPVRSVANAMLLTSPNTTELYEALRACGLSVITWPELDVQPLEVTPALAQAIDDLYGYDWLIFVSKHAVQTFLERLDARGHEVSELDSLRVCAIGEPTVALLEDAQVHIDVIATNFNAAAVVNEIATYVGGRDSLQRLNVLIPQAAIGREYLKPALEEASARADVLMAYRTVADSDATRLTALQTMLHTSSIDAVTFSTSSDVQSFARLFDTNDLGKVLKDTVAFIAGSGALELADRFGIRSAQPLASDSPLDMAQAIVQHFA